MLARIERDHRDDPQVAAALYQLLYETGVIPGGSGCRMARAAGRSSAAGGRRCARAGGQPHLDARQRSARPAARSALWTPS